MNILHFLRNNEAKGGSLWFVLAIELHRFTFETGRHMLPHAYTAHTLLQTLCGGCLVKNAIDLGQRLLGLNCVCPYVWTG